MDATKKIIQNILSRGTEDIIDKESIEKKLLSGKKLRIKLGIDPTSPNIHLGRAVPLRKLKKFQDLGHQIILIVGDFTAQIGDPSDKLSKRPMLSKEEIKSNMSKYETLLGKIIDTKNAEIHYNSEWLDSMRASELISIAEVFTVGQMSSRRNFKERLAKGEEVSLREFFYPLLQGYDSYATSSDVEVAGFDQLFNLSAGRKVQEFYNKNAQDLLTTQMLEGTDGRKMSGSWGNVINIDDNQNDMFGKIMSIKDDLISKYFLLCTDVKEDEIQKFEKEMKNSITNPREIKMKLAYEIVSIYHGADLAQKAKEHFIALFSNNEIPEDVPTVETQSGERLRDVLIREKIVLSGADFDRKVSEGAVNIIGEDKALSDKFFEINNECVVRLGRKIVKIKIIH